MRVHELGTNVFSCTTHIFTSILLSGKNTQDRIMKEENNTYVNVMLAKEKKGRKNRWSILLALSAATAWLQIKQSRAANRILLWILACSSIGAFAGCWWRWLPPGLPVEQPLVAAARAGAWQLTLILTAASLSGHHGRWCGCRCSRRDRHQYDVIVERPSAGGRPRRQDGKQEQQEEATQLEETASSHRLSWAWWRECLLIGQVRTGEVGRCEEEERYIHGAGGGRN